MTPAEINSLTDIRDWIVEAFMEADEDQRACALRALRVLERHMQRLETAERYDEINQGIARAVTGQIVSPLAKKMGKKPPKLKFEKGSK
jgi:hypothetical protein